MRLLSLIIELVQPVPFFSVTLLISFYYVGLGEVLIFNSEARRLHLIEIRLSFFCIINQRIFKASRRAAV